MLTFHCQSDEDFEQCGHPSNERTNREPNSLNPMTFEALSVQVGKALPDVLQAFWLYYQLVRNEWCEYIAQKMCE